MTISRDPDRLIRAFLEEGRDELPDRAYDEVRSHIDHTRQRAVLGPWREEQLSRYAIYGIAAAAIVLVVVVGIRFLPSDGGIGGQPTASPTPTLAPTPTPVADPQGPLVPGSYLVHPFGEPNRGMGFMFDVPSRWWEAVGPEDGRTDAVLKLPNNEGVGLAFLLIDSLNGDPCHWSGTADDVAVGPTVDDLITALESSDDFATSVESEATLGGSNGWRALITMPSTMAGESECDEGVYRIWNATDGFDIYAQGPENHWMASIVDVGGTRVVVLISYFDDTDPQRVSDLVSIVDSILITVP